MESLNKEQAILKAAEQEFMLKGYDGARTVSIAKSAGVTHAMLHYYFRTKEKLFEQVMGEKVKLLIQSLKLFFEHEELPILDRVRKVVESHFDFLVANPGLPKFIINECQNESMISNFLIHFIDHNYTINRAKIQSVLEVAAEKGEIKSVRFVDLLLTTISLNAMVFALSPVIQRFVQNEQQDWTSFLEQRKQINVEIVLNMLRK